MKCCACLKAKSTAISIAEDATCVVAEILRTHLSWVHLKVGDAVCTDCWTQVSTFHQFYMDIKVTHETLMAAKDSVKKDSAAAGDLGDDKIKIENVWHVNNEEAIENMEPENIFCEPLKDACNTTADWDNTAFNLSGFKIAATVEDEHHQEESRNYTLLSSSLPQSNDLLRQILANTVQTNIKMDILSNENKDLKERIQALGDENARMHTRLLTELTREGKSMEGIKETFLPKKPFSCVSELLLFDEKIANSADLSATLENEMVQINVSEPSKFVRTIWRRICSDRVAVQCSWKGTVEKTSISCLALTSIIRRAFNRKFNSDEQNFNTTCLRWFQTANDRLKYEAKKTS